MKNKKGDLVLPEFAKIILVLACLVALIYLAVASYNIFLGKNKIEQARASLNDISGKLQVLKENEEASYIFTAPLKWYFMFYEVNEESPKACKNKDCFCICEDNDISTCNKLGVCKNFDKKIILNYNGEQKKQYEISEIASLSLTNKQNGFEINIAKK